MTDVDLKSFREAWDSSEITQRINSIEEAAATWDNEDLDLERARYTLAFIRAQIAKLSTLLNSSNEEAK